MLTFLKTLFQKKPAATAAPAVAPAPSVQVSPTRAASTGRSAGDPGMSVPQVAVARLSLLAILQKLPEDLRANIAKQPEATVTIALPVATIQKQLAAGSVKMSLASLYRQAPAGTFNAAKVEEKRMIEVPLSEVLKHVEPQILRRRADQRRMELPTSTPQLFGDRANPFALTPSEGEEEPAKATNGNHHAEAEETPMIEGMTAPAYTLPLRMTQEPVAPAKTVPVAPISAVPDVKGDVTIPLAQLIGAWPEPARAEALALPEAALVVPAVLLAAGLAKGKVAFPWGRVRGWISPKVLGNTDVDEATEILLPLKIIAPAFLKHSRPQAPRREVDMDSTIPSLFDGGEAARPVTPAAPPISLDPEPAEAEPIPGAPMFRLAMTDASALPEVRIEIPLPPPVAEPVAAPSFGPSDKSHWSPQQMIESTAALPGVSGAIVALREGLVVAARLPEHMKGDTVAAFLPQIFARLNHYTQEMKLGEVEDLLLTIDGAHFQSYRLGEIYFAVLGKAGEALPWDELRLVVRELQAQTVA